MKVIKRDGRIVEYDKKKIITAIEKANVDVPVKEQAKKKDIDKIINHIEALDKKRILVEDIQDIIEVKLMELKKYELAKKYIVYRYNRALVRKQNTTDETILGLIRKNNSDFVTDKTKSLSLLASTQRNLIAAEVSKDLTKRMLLPEKINNACESGKIYFHDREYFLQPIFNSCLINLKDMLDNGTVMNNRMIDPPKSFQVACNIMTQIIATVASSQYGEQSVSIKHLSKYLRVSKEKFLHQLKEKYKDQLNDTLINEMVEDRVKQDLASGVQTIQYQLNTLLAINGHSPLVTLFLELDSHDPYIKETASVIEEILNQRYNGLKNAEGNETIPDFPKIIYVLNETNALQGGKYDYLTELAIECAKKQNNIYFISGKVMEENYDKQIFPLMGSTNFLSLYKEDGKYKFEGRFNQGIVSINLPQIAIMSHDMNEFYSILEERLSLCYDALMCRHYALLETSSEVSPVHYQYGAVARLNKTEKIDSLLKNGYSTLSLGYVGLKTMSDILKAKNLIDNNQEFSIDLLKLMNQKLMKWRKNTTIAFNLYQTSSKEIADELLEKDKDNFNIDGITSYENTFENKMSLQEQLLFEKNIQILSNGGMTIEVDHTRIENYEEFIKFIYDSILYIKIK